MAISKIALLDGNTLPDDSFPILMHVQLKALVAVIVTLWTLVLLSHFGGAGLLGHYGYEMKEVCSAKVLNLYEDNPTLKNICILIAGAACSSVYSLSLRLFSKSEQLAKNSTALICCTILMSSLMASNQFLNLFQSPVVCIDGM